MAYAGMRLSGEAGDEEQQLVVKPPAKAWSCLRAAMLAGATVLVLAALALAAAAAVTAKEGALSRAADVTHLALALVPAILVEIIVLKSSNPECQYVYGTDESISVQLAFNADLWQEHRKNPDRYWTTLTGMLGTSTLLRRLQGPLLALNLVAASSLLHESLLVPRGFPKLALPAGPFAISSFALGLLLVFRVNTASARYVKARNLWGDMLNISRDLTQQAGQWTADRKQFIDFAKWVPAFTASLMCGLRNPQAHNLAQELRAAAGGDLSLQGEGAGLSEEEIQIVCNRPNGMNAHHYCTRMLRTKTKHMNLPFQLRLLVEGNITRLINDMGACENIAATPIPVGYTKHTARFLLLWLFFAPFVMEGQLGVGIVFAQQMLSFALLGIEDIGVQIEQPFDVLPLKAICSKIANEGQIERANFDSLERDAVASEKVQR